jgi:hypothetical protein
MDNGPRFSSKPGFLEEPSKQGAFIHFMQHQSPAATMDAERVKSAADVFLRKER